MLLRYFLHITLAYGLGIAKLLAYLKNKNKQKKKENFKRMKKIVYHVQISLIS